MIGKDNIKDTFIVIELESISGFRDINSGKCVDFDSPKIVEFALVKIENNKIISHRHYFISIDGYNAEDMEIDSLDCCFYHNFNMLYMKGARTIEQVRTEILEYLGNATLVTRQNQYSILLDNINSEDFKINNKFIDIDLITLISRIQEQVIEKKIDFIGSNILTLANEIEIQSRQWSEIFEEYEVFFNPNIDNEYERDRDTPLSWAIAFAQFFINLLHDNNSHKLPF